MPPGQGWVRILVVLKAAVLLRFLLSDDLGKTAELNSYLLILIYIVWLFPTKDLRKLTIKNNTAEYIESQKLNVI